MKNKLIIDAGGSKVDYALVDDAGHILGRHKSAGMNALLASEKELSDTFQRAKEHLGQKDTLLELHFYGAGCATSQICSKVEKSLRQAWNAGSVQVNSDLLGAARSLLGKERGIACILGTGSNSGLYDGKKIIHNVPSLGFILGDEGSGAALGKRLVADAFKGHLPAAIRQKFMDAYSLSLGDILENTYRKPAAGKFLASLVPFISDHLWNPYMYSIVREEFISFFNRNIVMYSGSYTLPISFTGSVAWYFKDILEDVARSQGFKLGRVTRSPMEGLLAFHSGNVV